MSDQIISDLVVVGVFALIIWILILKWKVKDLESDATEAKLKKWNQDLVDIDKRVRGTSVAELVAQSNSEHEAARKDPSNK